MKRQHDNTSEQIETFKAMREHGKLVAKEREIINSKAIVDWCADKQVGCTFVNTWQLRLKNHNATIDIYVQSKKYHNIKENKRGKITGKIVDFLNEHFK